MRNKILTLALVALFQTSLCASDQLCFSDTNENMTQNLRMIADAHEKMLKAIEGIDDLRVKVRSSFVKSQVETLRDLIPTECLLGNESFVETMKTSMTRMTNCYMALNHKIRNGVTGNADYMLPFQRQAASYYETQLDTLGCILETLSALNQDKALSDFVKSETKRSVATRVEWLFGTY